MWGKGVKRRTRQYHNHHYYSSNAWFKLQSRAFNSETVKVEISFREPGWQLSALAQICTSFSPLLFATESLCICENLKSSSKLDWKDGIQDTEWLDFLFPFTAVKNLYLSKQFAPRIAPTLQELIGVRTTEVLPTLQNIFLEGFQPSESVEEGIGQFISPTAHQSPYYHLFLGHRPRVGQVMGDR